MMVAVLGTLPFLATLWLLVVLGASLLDESGAKIAAALKGDRKWADSSVGRSRSGVREYQLKCVDPEWRAVA
jgi:hypothetical protein